MNSTEPNDFLHENYNARITDGCLLGIFDIVHFWTVIFLQYTVFTSVKG